MVDLFEVPNEQVGRKEIELCCDLSVFNPRGGDQGWDSDSPAGRAQEDEELDAYMPDLDAAPGPAGTAGQGQRRAVDAAALEGEGRMMLTHERAAPSKPCAASRTMRRRPCSSRP